MHNHISTGNAILRYHSYFFILLIVSLKYRNGNNSQMGFDKGPYYRAGQTVQPVVARTFSTTKKISFLPKIFVSTSTFFMVSKIRLIVVFSNSTNSRIYYTIPPPKKIRAPRRCLDRMSYFFQYLAKNRKKARHIRVTCPSHNGLDAQTRSIVWALRLQFESTVCINI